MKSFSGKGQRAEGGSFGLGPGSSRGGRDLSLFTGRREGIIVTNPPLRRKTVVSQEAERLYRDFAGPTRCPFRVERVSAFPSSGLEKHFGLARIKQTKAFTTECLNCNLFMFYRDDRSVPQRAAYMRELTPPELSGGDTEELSRHLFISIRKRANITTRRSLLHEYHRERTISGGGVYRMRGG
jgi:hypothetical protein